MSDEQATANFKPDKLSWDKYQRITDEFNAAMVEGRVAQTDNVGVIKCKTNRAALYRQQGGYQVYNALSTIYAKAVLDSYHADSIAGSITSRDIIPAELSFGVATKLLSRVAPVGEIFDYINNQRLRSFYIEHWVNNHGC